MTFATLLTDLRTQNGWSNKEVADQVGVTAHTVSEWEQGNARPTIDQLLTLCELTGVELSVLLRQDQQLRHEISIGSQPRVQHMNGWQFIGSYWWIILAIGGYLSWLIPYFMRIFGH